MWSSENNSCSSDESKSDNSCCDNEKLGSGSAQDLKQAQLLLRREQPVPCSRQSCQLVFNQTFQVAQFTVPLFHRDEFFDALPSTRGCLGTCDAHSCISWVASEEIAESQHAFAIDQALEAAKAQQSLGVPLIFKASKPLD